MKRSQVVPPKGCLCEHLCKQHMCDVLLGRHGTILATEMLIAYDVC